MERETQFLPKKSPLIVKISYEETHAGEQSHRTLKPLVTNGGKNGGRRPCEASCRSLEGGSPPLQALVSNVGGGR